MAETAVGILVPKSNLPRPPADLLVEPFAAVGAQAITTGRGFLAG